MHVRMIRVKSQVNLNIDYVETQDRGDQSLDRDGLSLRELNPAFEAEEHHGLSLGELNPAFEAGERYGDRPVDRDSLSLRELNPALQTEERHCESATSADLPTEREKDREHLLNLVIEEPVDSETSRREVHSNTAQVATSTPRAHLEKKSSPAVTKKEIFVWCGIIVLVLLSLSDLAAAFYFLSVVSW